MANDFQKLVRARMQKTGESYSIARMQILAAGSGASAATPPASSPPPPPSPPLWDIWEWDGADITYDVQVALYDDLVECVQSGEYPVGYTEFEELMFRNVDREAGTAEFRVEFSADHPNEEDYSFNGHVSGTMRFDPDAASKEEFLGSVELASAQEEFDME